MFSKSKDPKYSALSEEHVEEENQVSLDVGRQEDDSAKDQRPSDLIEIQIKMLDDKKIPVKVDKNGAISDLKKAVSIATDVPTDQQRLIFSGQLLNIDDKPLADYKIKQGSFIHLVRRVQRAAVVLEDEENEEQNAPAFTDHPLYVPASQRIYVENLRVRGSGYAFTTHIWRSRVSFLSLVLLFFSALDLMGILFADEKQHHHEGDSKRHSQPYTWLTLFQLWQDIVGCYAGFIGMKATRLMDPSYSLRFYKSVALLAALYLLLGLQDVFTMTELHIEEKNRMNKGSIWIAIFIYFMMMFTIWGTCVYVAQRFHLAVLQENETNGSGQTGENDTPAQDESSSQNEHRLDIV